MTLLRRGPVNDRLSRSRLSKVEKQASHEMGVVLKDAEAKYQSGLVQLESGKEPEPPDNSFQKSIEVLNRGIIELGSQPVFFYDLALNYYRLRQFENARHFLKLSDAFVPSDKNVDDFESLRSLILSGSELRVRTKDSRSSTNG